MATTLSIDAKYNYICEELERALSPYHADDFRLIGIEDENKINYKVHYHENGVRKIRFISIEWLFSWMKTNSVSFNKLW